MDAQRVTSFAATLPPWLIADLGDYLRRPLDTTERRMDLAIELADRNWRAGTGGPFAALVVDSATGAIVSAGVNLVLSSRLSSTHAEVTALSLAQTRLGRWDLGADGAALELVASWRPCVMCYGATIWSGVQALTIAGEGPECETLTGFDEGPMPDDWRGELERRGIRVRVGVRREEAIEVLRAFGASDATVYNARGRSSR
jgi:tRNA(Arg) A34 adenosine deaminase TadA